MIRQEQQFDDQQELPADVEAEQRLIGCLLVDSRRYHEVARKISGEDFFDDGCRVLWKAIEGLMTAGMVDARGRVGNYLLDVKPIIDRVRTNGDFAKVPQTIGWYTEQVASGWDYGYYAHRIADMSLRRAMVLANYESISDAMSGHSKASDVLDKAMATISKVGLIRGVGATIRPLGEVIRTEVLPRVQQQVYGTERDESAIATGYPSIDTILTKLHRGGLIIIAGRTGQGKTSLAANIACNVAINQDKRVLFVTLEQTQREIAEMVWRGAARIGPIAEHMSDFERKQNLDNLNRTFDSVDSENFLLCEASGVSVEWIVSMARARMAMAPIDMLVIDYLAFIRKPQKVTQVTYQIAHITNALKQAAKQLNIPVILLAQVNRSAVSGKQKEGEEQEPELHHLKDSSSIEDDADVVMFVWHDTKSPDRSKAATVKIAKNRHGPKGRAQLHFLGYCKRFIEIPVESHSNFDPSLARFND